MSNEYTIATLDDFLAVPEDRIGACLADFQEWIRINRRKQDIETDLCEYLEVESGMVTLNSAKFIWCDDGIAGLRAIEVRGKDGSLHGRVEMEIE
jgi:hypothetical protein